MKHTATPSAQNSVRNWGWNFGFFAAALIYPCGGLFRQIGWLPFAGFVVLALAALYFVLRFLLPGLETRLPSGFWIGAVVFLLCVLCFTLARFPLFEHDHKILGITFGRADSNDAFVASWRALFAGRYPYYERSFLGNPLSPMPGALFWSLPFYALGITQFQNIFWLIAGWLGLAKLSGSWRLSSIAWLPLLLCPALIYSILQGGDYTSNSIYVILPAAFMVQWSAVARKWAYLAAVALGVSLSSRANFLLLVPVFFAGVWKTDNFPAAVKTLAISAFTCAAITLPFYFYDPAGFSPLHTSHKLDPTGLFSHAAPMVFLLGLAVATVLGVGLEEKPSPRSIWLRCFAVQGFVLLLGLMLSSIGVGALNLPYFFFGLLASVFGVYGAGVPLAGGALDALPANEDAAIGLGKENRRER